jgi:hypothetical protein
MDQLNQHFLEFIKLLEAEISQVKVKFISKQDLMRNKAAAGRAKDRIDLEELKKL